MNLILPKLEPDDYLKKDYEFWRNFRIILTEELKKEEEQLEKTPENIVKLAKEIGIKPTARYFDIYPSQVRYYIKKLSE